MERYAKSVHERFININENATCFAQPCRGHDLLRICLSQVHLIQYPSSESQPIALQLPDAADREQARPPAQGDDGAIPYSGLPFLHYGEFASCSHAYF
jgi:hypothetical protein